MNPTTLTSKDLNFTYTPAINYAFQQNHVPIIRELTASNNSESTWKTIRFEITTEPDFAQGWKVEAESLAAGESHQINHIPLTVSTKFLAELTEKISGSLILTIHIDDELAYQQAYPIEVLPFDQWPGVAILPEIMAEFVTPNHQQIPKIIHKAAALLEKWTGNPSFDDYQSQNPNRVRKQMAAIFETIASLQIVYCSVPASFEEQGQRVRLADAIFENKLANCFDISLLYTVCLEAASYDLLNIKGLPSSKRCWVKLNGLRSLKQEVAIFL